MAYSFRSAAPSDAEPLRTFSCADRGLRYTREVEQLIRSDVADEVVAGSGDAHVDIATDDTGLIVGVVTYGHAPLDGAVDVDNALFICALAVRPDHRRRVIGTLLEQGVLDAAHAPSSSAPSCPRSIAATTPCDNSTPPSTSLLHLTQPTAST